MIPNLSITSAGEIVKHPGISDIKLFDDLRIDEDKFWAMDREQILSYAPKYGSKNLNLLKKLFEKGK